MRFGKVCVHLAHYRRADVETAQSGASRTLEGQARERMKGKIMVKLMGSATRMMTRMLIVRYGSGVSLGGSWSTVAPLTKGSLSRSS